MAVSTAACVSSGGTWKTPKPSCGMVRPSLSVMSGIGGSHAAPLPRCGVGHCEPYPFGPHGRTGSARLGCMPKRRAVLLRIANVNPDSVSTHSDRVLYGAIGMFIILYFGYATLGGAAFVDASAGYAHPWWQWLVGPLVATGVVAYDRAVVGRVAVSLRPPRLGRPEAPAAPADAGLYLGRLGLALLFAVIITEPLMLARYPGEIDAGSTRCTTSRSARWRPVAPSRPTTPAWRR